MTSAETHPSFLKQVLLESYEAYRKAREEYKIDDKITTSVTCTFNGDKFITKDGFSFDHRWVVGFRDGFPFDIKVEYPKLCLSENALRTLHSLLSRRYLDYLDSKYLGLCIHVVPLITVNDDNMDAYARRTIQTLEDITETIEMVKRIQETPVPTQVEASDNRVLIEWLMMSLLIIVLNIIWNFA